MSSPGASPDRTSGPGGRVPAPLVATAALVGLEALLLVVVGVVEAFALSAARATMGATTAGFFVVYGAGLGWCAWRLGRGERWAVAPVVLAQLIQILVAWGFRGGATTLVAVLLIVVAVAALVGIFLPGSRAVLFTEEE